MIGGLLNISPKILPIFGYDIIITWKIAYLLWNIVKKSMF